MWFVPARFISPICRNAATLPFGQKSSNLPGNGIEAKVKTQTFARIAWQKQGEDHDF
jgi:hypothetical protein